MGIPREKNWTWIRKRYELGFTYRQIADDCAKDFSGESVSHQVIEARAKSEKWKRDLGEQYEQAVERKVMERGSRRVGVRRTI